MTSSALNYFHSSFSLGCSFWKASRSWPESVFCFFLLCNAVELEGSVENHLMSVRSSTASSSIMNLGDMDAYRRPLRMKEARAAQPLLIYSIPDQISGECFQALTTGIRNDQEFRKGSVLVLVRVCFEISSTKCSSLQRFIPNIHMK